MVDRARRGSDTLSTHALMRGAVLQLHRWGLLDAVRASGTTTIRSTTFHYGGERITLPIKERDGVDALCAPRRTVLDPIRWTRPRRPVPRSSSGRPSPIWGLGLEGFQWFYDVGAGVWSIPANDGETCVCASLPPSRLAAAIPSRTRPG